MSATTTLLDKYKETRSIPSDNAAAIALGLHRATVSGWRQRGTQAEPHVLAQMAKDVGEDAGGWLALVESERARSDADRKAWLKVARQLGAAAAVAFVALIALPLMAGTDGHGYAFLLALAVPERFAELCIMRNELLAAGGLAAALVALWRARSFGLSRPALAA